MLPPNFSLPLSIPLNTTLIVIKSFYKCIYGTFQIQLGTFSTFYNMNHSLNWNSRDQRSNLYYIRIAFQALKNYPQHQQNYISGNVDYHISTYLFLTISFFLILDLTKVLQAFLYFLNKTKSFWINDFCINVNKKWCNLNSTQPALPSLTGWNENHQTSVWPSSATVNSCFYLLELVSTV